MPHYYSLSSFTGRDFPPLLQIRRLTLYPSSRNTGYYNESTIKWNPWKASTLIHKCRVPFPLKTEIEIGIGATIHSQAPCRDSLTW